MKTHRLATLTLGSRPQKAAADAYWLELEQRLHSHLDKRCVITRKGRQISVDIEGSFTEAQLDHLARGAMRVWEWEATWNIRFGPVRFFCKITRWPRLYLRASPAIWAYPAANGEIEWMQNGRLN